MNYLAHAYLSFNQPQILVGNMISDFVKGKKQYEYAPGVLTGIKLHRSIDNFTDDHASTREIKKIFRPAYGLYAGAFTDIVYDHFLANDEKEFASAEMLQKFALDTYSSLEKNIDLAPAVFREMFPYMKKYDWFYNYRFQWGIERSFAGLARRAAYIKETNTAFHLFETNISRMKPFYDDFFPLLKNHAAHTLETLLNSD